MRTTQIVLISLVLSACASGGDSNLRIGMGIGSFGNSGGISVGGSTEVPVRGKGGSDARAALPFVQMPLDKAVISAVYPDKVLPFTANEDEVEALAKYVDKGTEPRLDEALIDNLDKCVTVEAQCRINQKE